MTPRACPICRRPLPTARPADLGPFCSHRCKLADLGNWLDGRYVVADESPFSELDGMGAQDGRPGPGASDDNHDKDGRKYE
ncbi:MAG: DNA gyrase inhibitor YacG [Myxococcales bacterium]|nr:DNA gyrase inhibitor YacG [Myxococcales bacterium]MDD9965411.1 DNA gyrase inhibitor YacG [Myxococcales bacterium]